MAKCDYLVDRFDIVGYDHHTIPKGENIARECLRAKRHEGPHLIKTLAGVYIVWEKDPCPLGECSACDDEDPNETCLLYGRVTSARLLQKYLDDPLYTGDDT